METLEKNDFRKKVKEQRRKLAPSQETAWNRDICDNLLGLNEIKRSLCIYCYISFHHEAGTGQLIEALLEMGKFVAVPKVVGKNLEFFSITGNKDLEKGVMGIMEPKPSCLKIRDDMAPVIVPGIAFDKKGHRIGYGGGYYDRFFDREPDHKRLAIAYDFQIFDTIPAEPHDKGMSFIITPKGVERSEAVL